MQEYLAVQKSMVAPEPSRLRNITHIHKVINKIVVERLKNYGKYIKQYALDNIAEVDRVSFEHFVLEDLKNLHEGILARYKIKPSDLNAWLNSL